LVFGSPLLEALARERVRKGLTGARMVGLSRA
jgi:hypothetical protein